MAVVKKTGKAYLRDTQPEVWKVAYEMSVVLAADLAGREWRDKTFFVDSFIRELVVELKGASGLDLLSQLPVSIAGGEVSEEADEAGQIVASIRAILTAALLDLPKEELEKVEEPESIEHALLLLVSELAEHNEAGRGYFGLSGVEQALEGLKPFAGLTVLLLADLASGHSMEAVASSEALRAMLSEVWGESLSVH